jgi:hypothetical protein
MMILHNKKEIVPEAPKVILLPNSCNRGGGQQGDSNGESTVPDKRERVDSENINKECILPH